METIALANGASALKFLFGGLGLLGLGGWLFWDRRGPFTLVLGLVFLGGVGVWLSMRLPTSISITPGAVVLEYPGLRFSRRLEGEAVAGTKIEEWSPGGAEVESWSLKLLTGDGDEIFLMDSPRREEIAALAEKIGAATAKPRSGTGL